MALRNTAPAAAPDLPLIPLDEHPAYARLLALRRSLTDAHENLCRVRDIAAIRGGLERSGMVDSRGERNIVQREYLARLEAQLPPRKPAEVDPSGLPPAVVAAMKLAAGESPERDPDPTVVKRRLAADIVTLDNGISVVSAAMDDIREEQSLVAAEQLRAQHREILRSVYTAAMALSAAVAAERDLFAKPIIAGYVPRPDVLHRPALDGAARLGSIAEHDSQISTFRRRLETLKVI